ncbi:MAG: hypothetical protein ACOYXS_08910 [Chloroflexota bacterium]
MLVTLLPASVVFAAVTVTTPATANVSADTAVSGYQALAGPALTEAAAGELGTGTIALDLPTGFAYNTASGSATMTGTNCGYTVSGVSFPTSAKAQVSVSGTASTGACTLTFSGLYVRATSGLAPLPSGNITNSGTAPGAPSPGNYGTLTEVPGAPILSFDPPGGQQPSPTATAGTAFATQPKVRARDQFGNPRLAGDVVTLAINSGGAPGATLTCDQVLNQASTVIVSGEAVATFTGCKIDKSSTTPYVLRATTPGGTTGLSTGITVSPGLPTKLGFVTQPARGTPSGAFAQQPAVAIQDAQGNTVTSASTSVTLTIGSNPGSGTLTCNTNPLATTNGVATFTGCRINNVGVGYTLTATGGGLAAGTSAAFDVADRLLFTTQPSGATGGTAFTTQPVVAVKAGATSTAVNDQATQVTLAIGTGPSGATLSCTTNPVTVVNGVATFAGCKLDKAGTYTLSASAPGLTSATQSLTVTVGAATKLGFTTQPSNATVTQPFTTQPVVAVQDAGGNTVTTGVNSTAMITLSLGSNPGGGTLTCTGGNSKAAVAGVASFAGCTIDKTGTGYTLVATASGLTAATSTAFSVSLPPAQITLSSTASVITWGSGVSLSVHFGTNGAGKSFQLQGARDGVSWATIATLTTDAAGNASYPYRPATNLYYRVNFAGAPDLQAGLSNTVRVVVRQIALLRPTNKGTTKIVTRNTTVTFVTTVRPARPELPAAKVTFRIYRNVSGVWRYVTRREYYINAAGQASMTWTFSTRGEWYVRSIANPTPYNANSVWSPLERYSVR